MTGDINLAQGGLPDIFRRDINGLTVLWSTWVGQFTASLTFRVGRSDETAATRGITHLVEHLAFPAAGHRSISRNAGVDDHLTTFWAQGEQEEVMRFIAEVAANLSDLPTDRMSVERGVLLTEAENWSTHPAVDALNARLGMRGAGLSALPEFGIEWLGGQRVREWAAERFTRENAVLSVTAEPDGDLDLPLIRGQKFTLGPAPAALPGHAPPCRGPGRDGGVMLTATGQKGAGLGVGLALARDRAEQELRHNRGLSYEVGTGYGPMAIDLMHGSLWADCRDDREAELARVLVDTVDGIARDGPTQDEMAHITKITDRNIREPDSNPRWLYSFAMGHLMFDELDGWADQVTAVHDTEGLQRAMSDSRDTLYLFAPNRVVVDERFHQLPDWMPVEAVSGREFRRPGLRNRVAAGTARITVSPDGLTWRNGPKTSTIRFDALALSIEWGCGTRQLMAVDGSTIWFKPALYHNGDALAKMLNDHTPNDRQISLPRARPR